MLDDWICALFSMDSGAIIQAQRDAIAALNVQWVLLNVRNARFYIELCGPQAQLVAIRNYLISIGRNPKVIGVFDHSLVDDGSGNGTLMQVEQWRSSQGFDQVEYLNVAPDVKTYNPDGSLASSVRPMTFTPIHKFAGWGDKVGVPF